MNTQEIKLTEEIPLIYKIAESYREFVEVKKVDFSSVLQAAIEGWFIAQTKIEDKKNYTELLEWWVKSSIHQKLGIAIDDNPEEYLK